MASVRIYLSRASSDRVLSHLFQLRDNVLDYIALNVYGVKVLLKFRV